MAYVTGAPLFVNRTEILAGVGARSIEKLTCSSVFDWISIPAG